MDQIKIGNKDYKVTDVIHSLGSEDILVQASPIKTRKDKIIEAIRTSNQDKNVLFVSDYKEILNGTRINCIVHGGYIHIQKLMNNCSAIGWHIDYVEPRDVCEIYLNGNFKEPTVYPNFHEFMFM